MSPSGPGVSDTEPLTISRRCGERRHGFSESQEINPGLKTLIIRVTSGEDRHCHGHRRLRVPLALLLCCRAGGIRVSHGRRCEA